MRSLWADPMSALVLSWRKAQRATAKTPISAAPSVKAMTSMSRNGSESRPTNKAEADWAVKPTIQAVTAGGNHDQAQCGHAEPGDQGREWWPASAPSSIGKSRAEG